MIYTNLYLTNRIRIRIRFINGSICNHTTIRRCEVENNETAAPVVLSLKSILFEFNKEFLNVTENKKSSSRLLYPQALQQQIAQLQLDICKADNTSSINCPFQWDSLISHQDQDWNTSLKLLYEFSVLVIPAHYW